MTTMQSGAIPGYVSGTWDIDPIHSEIGFVVRHLVVSKVRGRFDAFQGTIVLAEDPLRSTAEATIDAVSINTNQQQRDDHVRSADFFDAANHPHITFRSTGVRPDEGTFLLDGELTIRGTTRAVTLDLELNGFGPDPYGGTRVGFSATGDIDRQDFGVSFNGPIPGADNAMVLSDKVAIHIEVEAVLRAPAG